MFAKLGGGITRRPLVFIFTWVVLLGIAISCAFFGFGKGGLFDRMESSESMSEGTESDEVAALTATSTHLSVTVVVDGVSVAELGADPTKAMAVVGALAQLGANEWVESVVHPFLFPDPTDPNAQALYSANGTGFVAAITLVEAYADLDSTALKDAKASVSNSIEDVQTALQAVFPDARALELSNTLVGDAINELVQSDLVRSETITLPVALILMIIVFGGVIAAGLPLVGAIVSIVIGLGAVWGLTLFISVDSFLLNVISIIGVALSIDYGLLVVSRYREEVARLLASDAPPLGEDGEIDTDEVVRQALVSTISTAGRTVSFSALTIACSLAGLFVLESEIFRTIAFGAVSVTVLAVATAVTLVPAVIRMLGPALVRPSLVSKVPGLKQVAQAMSDSTSDTGVFSRLAHFVHGHPWIIMTVVIAILGALAWPIVGLKPRTAFADYLPADKPVTQAYDIVQQQYPALRSQSVIIVADAPAEATVPFYQQLTTTDGVSFVMPPQPLASDPSRTVISLYMDVPDQVGQDVTDLVLDLRDGQFDTDYPILVGGNAALQHDFVSSLLSRAWIALLIIVAAVFILLFLMTGSLVVPLKALIINSLSLLASMGATWFIFSNGYLGMPKVFGIETFIIACTISFGFGLAMDYEVFLLARIKEYWDAGDTNDEAVEHGLQRSGRIITSAALIIIAVFIGFTFGDMVAIKEIGVALALTVLVDATLVRMLLVPATMTLLGHWNWWAPKPLVWVYDRFKIIH
ncbi:MAG: MMPL family transporter [Propionibacteriaceae bacterium]|jgi:RND superfamily putative drug exporter|nr:MMPL family transporter [Propionibacteriaceae bacterium]